MLVQLRDEFLPAFSIRNNIVSLELDENIKIYADPEKMARVFGNILKNTAAYSYPDTEVTVSAAQQGQYIAIMFKNRCKTIPAENLASLFDKFYRLDEARISDTGAQGLDWRSPKKSFFCTAALLKRIANMRLLLSL